MTDPKTRDTETSEGFTIGLVAGAIVGIFLGFLLFAVAN